MTKTLVAARPPAAPPALPLDAIDPAARARLTAAFARADAAVREAKAALAADLIAVASELSGPVAAPVPPAVPVVVVPVRPAAAAPPPDPPPAAGATPTHRAAVLRALAAAPDVPVSARAIADATGLSAPAVGAALGDLRRLGRVERVTDRPPFTYRAVAPADGRPPRPSDRPVAWQIRDILAAGPATAADVRARVGRPAVVVQRALYDLCKDGSVRLQSDGRYAAGGQPPAPDTLVWRVLDVVVKAGAAGVTAAAAAAALGVRSVATSPLTALYARGLVTGIARRASGTKNAVVYAATALGREVLAGHATWPMRTTSRPLLDLPPAATLRALRVLEALTGTRPGAAAAGGEVVAGDAECRPSHLAVAVRDKLARRLQDGRYQLTPRGRAAIAAADRAAIAAAR